LGIDAGPTREGATGASLMRGTPVLAVDGGLHRHGLAEQQVLVVDGRDRPLLYRNVLPPRLSMFLK
jgi:hypothetical protein